MEPFLRNTTNASKFDHRVHETETDSRTKFDFRTFLGLELLYRHSVSLLQDAWVLTSRHLEQGGSRWNLYPGLCCLCKDCPRR
jgi:hypothetical protein